MNAEPHTRAPVRVLLADDHPIVLQGVADLVASAAGFEVVARCADGRECIAAIRSLQPDIALIDIVMPALGGIDVLRLVNAENMPARVVFFTATSRSGDIVSALNEGVHGMLLKDDPPARIIEALRAVAAGERWIPQEIVDAALARDQGHVGDGARKMAALSDRERDVARMAGIGLPNKVIADRLGLTEGTVKNHLHRIFEKLGVANRTALALLISSNRRR